MKHHSRNKRIQQRKIQSGKVDPLSFVLSIVLCECAGIIGAFITFPAINKWYVTLTKPTFVPPNWIFGPVWTILYFLMGIALYRAWQKNASTFWFWVQLILNIMWSFVFFGMHDLGFAFLTIVVLWMCIAVNIRDFIRKDRVAGWILVPYIIWVSFAGILNLALWQLNK